ncbi:unnamed protein product [Didymodactylos carnosus]|uniref:Uncharacterized protein n=1 Tax=Didymodactylos carnosus TaxID=1234261 RepID=A0A813QBX2_9BILA|nr:unnamed protein product [Didymodactylos carnosus]CAF3545895.1 unnamed protein product [Didymodactylos carnosus]
MTLASLCADISLVYDSLGEYAKALEYLKKSRETAQDSGSEICPGFAAKYNQLGAVYYKQGKIEEVLELYEKSLEIQLKVLRPDHPNLQHVTRDPDDKEGFSSFKARLAHLLYVFTINYYSFLNYFQTYGDTVQPYITITIVPPPPKHLNAKQAENWRRANNKSRYNEELRNSMVPFDRPPWSFDIVFVNYTTADARLTYLLETIKNVYRQHQHQDSKQSNQFGKTFWTVIR